MIKGSRPLGPKVTAKVNHARERAASDTGQPTSNPDLTTSRLPKQEKNKLLHCSNHPILSFSVTCNQTWSKVMKQLRESSWLTFPQIKRKPGPILQFMKYYPLSQCYLAAFPTQGKVSSENWYHKRRQNIFTLNTSNQQWNCCMKVPNRNLVQTLSETHLQYPHAPKWVKFIFLKQNEKPEPTVLQCVQEKRRVDWQLLDWI